MNSEEDLYNFDRAMKRRGFKIVSIKATTEPKTFKIHKGYALDCSGWVFGKLYTGNPRFEAMIYDGNEYIAVKPETVEIA